MIVIVQDLLLMWYFTINNLKNVLKQTIRYCLPLLQYNKSK